MSYEQFITPSSTTQESKKVFLVDTKTEYNRNYSDIMMRGINKTLRQGGTVIIICNKASYANGYICDKCGHIPQCKQCDIAVSHHKPAHGKEFSMCHICKSYYDIPQHCPHCKQGTLSSYGIGIEQVAEYLQQEFKTKPLIIKSSSAGSLSKVKKLEEHINKSHIIIGTSLLSTAPMSKGEPPKSGLTILMNADSPLSIPDYESEKKCFHLIYDTITNSPHHNIIVQTKKADHDTIRLACALNKTEFYTRDNQRKKEHNYPPFGDICVLLYKNEIEQNVFTTINKLYQELLYLKERHTTQNNDNNEPITKPIHIYATPPLIYKAYNKYRYHIIITGSTIRNFMEHAFSTLKINKRGFKVDRQARELL